MRHSNYFPSAPLTPLNTPTLPASLPPASLTAACGSQKQKHSKLRAKKKKKKKKRKERKERSSRRFHRFLHAICQTDISNVAAALPPVRRQRQRRLRIGFVFLLPQTNFNFSRHETITKNRCSLYSINNKTKTKYRIFIKLSSVIGKRYNYVQILFM